MQRKRDWVIIMLIYTVAILLGAIGFTNYATWEQESRVHTTVYEVCHYSHLVRNTQAEEACGRAQDASTTEFLCESREPDARCWVEDK